MLKKLCRRENNTNHEDNNGGIHLSRIQCLPLFLWIHSWLCQMVSQSGPMLPIQGCRQSTVCGCLLQIWLDLIILPCQDPSALGPKVVLLMTLSLRSTCLWFDRVGGNPGSLLWGTIQYSGKMVRVFPHPLTRSLGLFQILSNTIWFLVNLLTVSCVEPLSVKGSALSCWAQTATLPRC